MLWRLLEGFSNCAGCVISIILAVVFVLMIAAASDGTGSWSSVVYFIIVALVAGGRLCGHFRRGESWTVFRVGWLISCGAR